MDAAIKVELAYKILLNRSDELAELLGEQPDTTLIKTLPKKPSERRMEHRLTTWLTNNRAEIDSFYAWTQCKEQEKKAKQSVIAARGLTEEDLKALGVK